MLSTHDRIESFRQQLLTDFSSNQAIAQNLITFCIDKYLEPLNLVYLC